MKEFSKSKKPKNPKNPNPKNFAPKKTQKNPKNPRPKKPSRANPWAVLPIPWLFGYRNTGII